MALSSNIEWTEATWNPISGCTVLSPGCTNCYAMRMARRLEAMGQEKYRGTTRVSGGRAKWTGKVKFDPSSLDLPRHWKRGRLIFVNSMSDLFHDAVPFEFIEQIFKVMKETPQHTYQLLTKRAERLSELDSRISWPSNVWMGVSVESEDYWWRVDHLREVGAKVRFVSLEPLLGPLTTLNFSGIHWAIAGGRAGLTPDQLTENGCATFGMLALSKMSPSTLSSGEARTRSALAGCLTIARGTICRPG